MTKKEIIEMAEKAGITISGEAIFRLCELVEKHERIACANIADSYVNGLERNYSEIIAEKIIARGQE
jgi:Ran GTPase-activating protein (RanGAP) involved in mRNA processing and transport